MIKKSGTGILFSLRYCRGTDQIRGKNIYQSVIERRVISTIKNTIKMHQKQYQNIHQAEICRAV